MKRAKRKIGEKANASPQNGVIDTKKKVTRYIINRYLLNGKKGAQRA